jgi:hypothetical protein
VNVRASFLTALLLVLPAVATPAPARLRPAAPDAVDVPKRFALEATVSPLFFDGVSVAAGVRARVRDDPFQFEASWDQDLSDRAQPDFRWLALGGGGLVRELSPRCTLYGTFLLGAYGVAIRDSASGAWQSAFGPAVGGRASVAWHFSALRVLSVEPTLGFSATLVLAATRHHDFAGERLTWGGPAALFSVSVGGASRAPVDAAVPVAP